MTTHLHPDGLPIIATPIVDSQKVAIKDFGDMVYFVVAEELEERARTAEAQLAVAVALLEYYAADTGGTTRAKLALAEIRTLSVSSEGLKAIADEGRTSETRGGEG